MAAQATNTLSAETTLSADFGGSSPPSPPSPSLAGMLRRQATADQRRADDYRRLASALPSVAAPSASRRACAFDLKATVLSLAAEGLEPTI